MASKIKVDQIEGSAGSSITIPSGQTLTITDGLASSTITSGTLADARIPNLNASKITAGTIATARLGSGTASSSTFLRGDSTFAAVGGGGKVLQVVQGTKTDSTLSTSSSYVATGLSVAITPSASTSKVLVMVSAYVDSNANSTQSVFTIYRGSTDLGNGTGGMQSNYVSGERQRAGVDMIILDTPNTTSATTYQMYMKNSSGSNIQLNSEGGKVTITAMEIGA